jgi:hypothetical protein
MADFMVAVGRWHFEPDGTSKKTVKDSGPATGQDVKDWVQSFCDAAARASSPLTVDDQSRPENSWTVHPVIDGCQPEGERPRPSGVPH